MADIVAYPKFQAFDSSGNPLSSGKIYTYISGTTTAKATYTTAAASVENSNPIVLDSRGEASIYLAADAAYRFVIKDSNDVTINTVDNIVGWQSISISGLDLGGDLEINDYNIVDNNDNEYIDFTATASAVNSFACTNAASGNRPIWSVSGDDTNVSGELKAKGTGGWVLTDGNGNEVVITGAGTASAVNEVTITNAATGNAPTVATTGGDTNAPIRVSGKGTGAVELGQATATGVVLIADQPLVDSSSNELIKFTKVATAVNEITVSNNATGSGPSILATGGDTNIPITLGGKGTGKVILGQATSTEVQLVADQPFTDSSGNEYIKFSKASSAVNEITVANQSTGNNPVISATGGDTNIGLDFQTKGTGVYNYKGTADQPAEIRLFEDTDNGSNYIGLKAPSSVTSNVSFRLPSADGTNGQVLATDGSGNWSFTSAGSGNPAGSNGQVQYNNAGSFGGDTKLSTSGSGAWTMAAGGSLAFSGSVLNYAKGADIASSATVDIGGATGNVVDVTGTTTITSLGTVQAGTVRIVRFTGTLTLTHNATSLILPGQANITTANGDIAQFVSLGSGNWYCANYSKTAGDAVVLDSYPALGRLTLTTGLPVTTADVTAAGTIYYTPYIGNKIALYDGVNTWTNVTFTELSLALTATSGKPYDVFIYNNSGTATLETLVWTNDTTRATALTYQNGVLVKTGDSTRRYIGTFYASGTNTTEDSLVKRYVWNAYNRIPRPMKVLESTASWTYTTATLRQANNTATNQLDVVQGLSDMPVEAHVYVSTRNTSANAERRANIGIDSTTTSSTTIFGYYDQAPTSSVVAEGHYYGTLPVGRHTLTWLEYSAAIGTCTWVGSGLSGIVGVAWC